MKKTGRAAPKIERNALLITKDASFEFTEAYKALRTNLQFASINTKLKKIIVTSSIPGEGKTTVSVNLAIAMAENGQRVLLIDADLRKPHIHHYLKIDQRKVGSLTTALAGITPIEKCIAYFSDLGIYVLTAGPIPPNPAELLCSERMEEFIEGLSENYDYIIIDTPPVSVVTDAAALSRVADGVVMVVRQGYTPYNLALAAKDNLEKVHANIVGCVFNSYDSQKDSKPYSSYYYKYKSYGYGDGAHSK